jgi:hypothetical protein
MADTLCTFQLLLFISQNPTLKLQSVSVSLAVAALCVL